jgi:hypothetical protein
MPSATLGKTEFFSLSKAPDDQRNPSQASSTKEDKNVMGDVHIVVFYSTLLFSIQ